MSLISTLSGLRALASPRSIQVFSTTTPRVETNIKKGEVEDLREQVRKSKEKVRELQAKGKEEVKRNEEKLKDKIRELQLKDLERLTRENPDKFRRPERGDINDPKIEWRNQEVPRDYVAADHLYFIGKTKEHIPDSPEDIVETLVKLWEFEASHKANMDQWDSVIPKDEQTGKTYKFSVTEKYDDPENKGLTTRVTRTIPGDFAKEMGNYGALLAHCQQYRELMESRKEGGKSEFEKSHEIFKTAMPGGFGWELLEFTEKPTETGRYIKIGGEEMPELRVAFKWRHWATLEKSVDGGEADGRHIEFRGDVTAWVVRHPDTGKYKIRTFDVNNMEIPKFFQEVSMTKPPEKAEIANPVYDRSLHGKLEYDPFLGKTCKVIPKKLYFLYKDDSFSFFPKMTLDN